MTPIVRDKIIFAILVEISFNDNIPSYDALNITQQSFVEILKFMTDLGYLEKKYVLFNILGFAEIEKNIGLVTEKGIKYIEDHSAWCKIYKKLDNFQNLIDL